MLLCCWFQILNGVIFNLYSFVSACVVMLHFIIGNKFICSGQLVKATISFVLQNGMRLAHMPKILWAFFYTFSLWVWILLVFDLWLRAICLYRCCIAFSVGNVFLQISNLLVVDPYRRFTAKQALGHPFLQQLQVNKYICVWIFVEWSDMIARTIVVYTTAVF